MQQKEKQVLVIGSINMDLVVRTEKLPTIGETIFGKTFARFPGGKGANQAIAAARLGAQVSMVGCVGEDDFGRELFFGLRENHVDVSFVGKSAEATGIALITVADRGSNTIVVVPGANNEVAITDVDKAFAKYNEPGVLLVQQEIPSTVVRYAIETAKKNNWLVILNPAPAREVSDEVLRCVDILIPNETEASVMTGRTVGSIEDARLAAEVLLAKGIGAVIVTLGSQGAFYCRKGFATHIAPIKVDAIDSTAAGDAFVGALACALARGEAIAEGLQFAAKVAALSVTRPGAQASLPWRRELEV